MSDQQTEQALGKYTILRELGRGGFATVYLAQDNVLRRSIALKILHPLLLADPDFVRRFEQEAHATAQLDHPHIATIYELGQLEGRLYIAIQLLAGGTLADRIRQRGPLPFAETVRVVGEIAEALDHAHAAGFVHRDVKPTNILFNARDEAVLTDFGMVKAVESSVIARSTMGNVIGTPPYIAPEVWEGKQDGPGTDVYALGCVLFEMLTGELLFKGKTPPAVMLAHFQPHQYPARWPDGVPPQIEALLERALSRDPGDRYASAGALATDLRDLTARAADPLAERYRALQSAIAAQDWERASQLAQEIATQNPNYRDVPALARQAAEGQAHDAQMRWVGQWHEQALAAERAGQIDAARVATQRWLELAPDDAEARALLARLDALAARGAEVTKATEQQQWRPGGMPSDKVAGPARPVEHPAMATRGSLVLPAGIALVGWVAGWFIAIESARLAGHTAIASVSGWMLGWAIAGLLTGLTLHRAEPSFGGRRIAVLALGWPLCLALGLLFGAWFYLTTRSAFGLALGVALAGFATGATLLRLWPSITWWRVLAFTLVWSIGWVIGEVIRVSGQPDHWRAVLDIAMISNRGFEDAFQVYGLTPWLLALGGIISAIAGGGLLWLVGQARRDGQQRN